MHAPGMYPWGHEPTGDGVSTVSNIVEFDFGRRRVETRLRNTPNTADGTGRAGHATNDSGFA
eukprot:2728220-Prymnesium_polylepis.1